MFISRKGPVLMIGRTKITAKRWPWQAGYNWHGMTNSTAPLNQPLPGEKAAPRFGGGWKYELGISIGGSTINISLWFGFISITRLKRLACPHCKAKVDEYHTETCPKYSKQWGPTSWLNKESGR